MLKVRKVEPVFPLFALCVLTFALCVFFTPRSTVAIAQDARYHAITLTAYEAASLVLVRQGNLIALFVGYAGPHQAPAS